LRAITRTSRHSERPNHSKELYGAGSRVRTRDPLITNQVLYQLSYTGTCGGFSILCVLRQAEVLVNFFSAHPKTNALCAAPEAISKPGLPKDGWCKDVYAKPEVKRLLDFTFRLVAEAAAA
jgi:hypothetical protein